MPLEEKSSIQGALLTILDAFEKGHTLKVDHRAGQYVDRLARKLQYHTQFRGYLTGSRCIDLLSRAAMLHDIGKLGIPQSILCKPGPLNQNEFEVMKMHTLLGAKTIEATQIALKSPHPLLQIAYEMACYHHEKWDGSGYPYGLKGEAIPFSARLVALADVYDALTSKRIYKAAWSHQQAVQMILDGQGRHFDPDIVDVFLENADEFDIMSQGFLAEHSDPHFSSSKDKISAPLPIAGQIKGYRTQKHAMSNRT